MFSRFEASALEPTYSKSEVCQKAQKKFENRFTQLQKKYQRLDTVSVSDENKPSWVWGRKRQAVYLLHGFIGTPNEMSAVALKLQEKNLTVINDLIPGYGTTGFIANQFDQQTWKKHVEANLNSVRECFDQVHLIGFSTGGLLLHHYIRQHTEDFTAQSITLYSPFYKPHLAFADFLRTAARTLTSTVLTKLLYDLTHFPDIKVAVLKPQNYLQQLPLDAAEYVLDFGAEVDSQIKSSHLNDETTPALLFVSNTDQIMNLDITVKNVSADFLDLTVVKFDKKYVPHHLMVDEVSSVAPFVQDKTVEFILSHSR